VIDVVGATGPLTVTVGPSPTGLSAADLDGFYGMVVRAGAAKHQTDLDRTTPGSNKVKPAYTSVLASQGEALAYLAGGKGGDPKAFAAAVRSAPALLTNASAEMATDDKASSASARGKGSVGRRLD
jgi:hypothetical protein